MTIYYSPSTPGFYDTSLVEYPNLPEDCIEITAEQRETFIYEMNHNNNHLVVENDELVLKNRPFEVTWETIRLERNSLLTASDYTQVPDYPGDKQAWMTYRQKLRDLPQVFENPEDVDWPVPPKS